MNFAGNGQLAAELLLLDKPALSAALAQIFAQPRLVQDSVLADILRRARGTAFGKQHGFDRIKSCEDYRRAVPVTQWADYEGYVGRMLEGNEPDILFAGRATSFFATTGTTTHVKYIPESAAGIAARRAIGRARNLYLFSGVTRGPNAKILPLANQGTLAKTKSGVAVQTASGAALELYGARSPGLFAYPPEAANHLSGDALRYLILRCALACPDVVAMLGNSAAAVLSLLDYADRHAEQLARDIETGSFSARIPAALEVGLAPFAPPRPARGAFLRRLIDEGRFTPGQYWPALQLAGLWLGGSVGLGVPRLRQRLPGVRFFDVGYGASELKINIPTEPETPAGALATFCGFFEFVDRETQEILRAHELEDGKQYELVVTTYAGLYRYCMQDIVQVQGYCGETPNLFFVSKVADIANLHMEKFAGAMIAAAVEKAVESMGLGFVFAQVCPSAEQGRYIVYLELAGPYTGGALLEERVDEALCEANVVFREHRATGVIGPTKVCLARPGWYDSLRAGGQKGAGLDVQAKPLVVVAAQVNGEYLL